MENHLSFADDFDAPVIETIGGEAISFPLLTCEDLAIIERMIFNEKKVVAINAMAAHDARGRQETENYFAELTMTANELAKEIGTIPGAKKALAVSLARSTTPKPADAIALQMSRERGWLGVVEVARIISGLWPITRGKAKEKPSPNAGPATGESPVAETSAAKDSSPTGLGYGEPTASMPVL